MNFYLFIVIVKIYEYIQYFIDIEYIIYEIYYLQISVIIDTGIRDKPVMRANTCYCISIHQLTKPK